jgi:methyl-accepting chemotaxis protein
VLGLNQELNAEAHRVHNTADSVYAGAQGLAQASTEQAAALQETAASIEEMSAMVKKSSQSAERSREFAAASHNVASKGKAAVEDMVKAMEDINHSNVDVMRQIEDSNRQISEIIKVITEIGNKTKVINEIVFQTKLLSFNASVEAARAGEHGKGFAVVAEEVGNLAQMSGNASKEISDMLSGSIQKVEGIVNETRTKVERLMAHGRTKTESGTVIARQCGQILEEVVKNVGEVSVMVADISTAAHEQALGISEITKAMNQLDQVTHENAATSQDAAKSSSQLLHQADGLFSTVAALEKTLLGQQQAPARDPAVKQSAGTESRVPRELGASNVVSLRRPVETRTRGGAPGVLRTSGGDYVPDEHDSRFEDL